MHILFAIPGRSFSRRFLLSWMDLVHHCYKMEYNQRLHTVDCANVFQARDILLAEKPNEGGFQSPFQGMYDYICWIDSDQIFTPQDLERLLSFKEDMVCGWCHAGVNDENEALASFGYMEDNYQKCPRIRIEDLDKQPKDERGLIEVDFTGFPFVLIKNGVFEKIEYPWFSPTTAFMKQLAEREKGKDFINLISEDILFSMKVRDAGFKIWVDPSVRVGHEKLTIL